MTGALGVITQPESELEARLDQVGDVSGFGFGGGGFRNHNGLDDSKGGGFLSLDKWFLDAIGFKLTAEAPVQSGVGLGVWRISWFGEAIQDLGC